MRLISAILARNEGAGDRYLQRVLARLSEFSDDILFLDDGSTDNTTDIAEGFPKCLVKRRSSVGGFWNETAEETPARAELWDRATKLAKGGWVLICDADMLLMGDPRPYCYSWDVGMWCWPLADCWDREDQMRVDGPWEIGARTPRPWLFNVGALPKDWTPEWGGRGIHAGHCPSNFSLLPCVAPELWWKHLSFTQKGHRSLKHAQYARVAAQLTDFERLHCASIAD